jgi:hypothetical protein
MAGGVRTMNAPVAMVETRFQKQAALAVLESGSWVALFSLMLALFAMFSAALFWQAGKLAGVAWSVVSLALGMAQSWYALRVRLDARLFAIQEMEHHLAAIDWLIGLLRAAPAASRSLEDRIKGALRLWKRQVALAVAQAACLLAAWCWLIARLSIG